MYQIDFNKPQHIYFMGIGGISMSGLAEILMDEGFTISGSDSKESELTEHLRSRGAFVSIGQRAENIAAADEAGGAVDAVVYTAAIHPDNPEFQAAQQAGIPMMSRAVLLGEMMRNYKEAIAVSGTHGKTTTTSMLSEIFLAAKADPTISVGGILPSIGGNIRVGGPEFFITEACEYTNSFLEFFPTMALILNIEEDHLDFFKDLADIEHSFHAFADLVPQRGYIISNADDAGARDSVKGLQHPVFTFAVQDRTADCVADNVSFFDGCPVFDVVIHGEVYAHVELKIPGKHNILNTLAAASAAYVLGLPGEAVSRGLETFHGAGRRMEHKGTYHGAEVYDDYAHHPGELHALLTTARTMGYQRVICAFQPHTYSRTKALFSQFVEELKLPDVTVLAEIYAAREQNDIGISSQDLAREIPGAIYCSSLEKVTDTLASLAQPGDLILTVGAGDIFRAGEKLLERA